MYASGIVNQSARGILSVIAIGSVQHGRIHLDHVAIGIEDVQLREPCRGVGTDDHLAEFVG